MKAALPIVLGLLATPAVSQDIKVLLCTAQTQLNLNSDRLEPVPSDETYTWELNYDAGGELVAVSAPFDCREGTEAWNIGATVISLTCQQGIEGVTLVNITAEIDRYAQSFMVSGISEEESETLSNRALWVQEGRCELARRKF